MQDDMKAGNAQLTAMPEDDERFPLSPSRSSQVTLAINTISCAQQLRHTEITTHHFCWASWNADVVWAWVQHTAISRKSPTEPHTDAFRRSAPAGPSVPAARSQQPAAPHHKRRSSLLSDLAEDFSISLSDTRRQVPTSFQLLTPSVAA